MAPKSNRISTMSRMVPNRSVLLRFVFGTKQTELALRMTPRHRPTFVVGPMVRGHRPHRHFNLYSDFDSRRIPPIR